MLGGTRERRGERKDTRAKAVWKGHRDKCRGWWVFSLER